MSALMVLVVCIVVAILLAVLTFASVAGVCYLFRWAWGKKTAPVATASQLASVNLADGVSDSERSILQRLLDEAENEQRSRESQARRNNLVDSLLNTVLNSAVNSVTT